MRTRTIALAVALALGAGGLAACGSGDEAADTATQTAGAATAASTTASATATGEPIRVGFLNQEKGAAAFPDFGAGARAASEHLNEDVGGVDGRPLELVECLTDGTPESSIDCANRFAEEGVAVVLQGIDFSSDAALPILEEAGIPFVGHTAFGTAQSVSEDAFFFGAALPAYGVAPLQVMSDRLGATSAVYVGADQKLIRAFVDGAIGPAAKQLGIDLTPIYYQSGSADFSSVITSAMAKKPDVIFTTAPDPDCIGMVKAASTLGYQGDVFAGSCSAFIAADPSSADGVFTSSDLWEPEAAEQAPPEKREQIETYVAQMEQRAPDHVAGFAQDTFSSTMDLAAVLGTVEGEITPESVTAALRATAGLDSFMGQELTCDGKQWPGQPSACGAGILVYQVEGEARVPVTDGFVDAADLVG